MADSETAPLLGDESVPKTTARDSVEESIESTPLLVGSDATPRYDGEHDEISSVTRGTDASSVRSAKKGRRWPSIVAMIMLALLSLGIVIVAFFVPAAVEEYAKQAFVVEPTNLALDSITTDGVRARVQANLRLDAQRVKNDHVRRIGRLTTWIVRELGTEETVIDVHLPAYDGLHLGKAGLPPLSISLVDGQNTAVDFIADLIPGDAEGYRTIANDWLEGKLDALRVQAKADIRLKSGIIPLGTHSIIESLTIEGQYLYRSFAAMYFGE